jgi:hypothetical protein
MNASPETTLIVAIYAAAVSTGLLILRMIELLLEAGWVSVSTWLEPATDELAPVLVVKAVNRGRGPASITRLDLDSPGPVLISLMTEGLVVSGPELPHSLAARTSAIWHVDANKLKTLVRSHGWNSQVRGIVTLATGKRVWESIHRYTPLH